MYFCNVFCVLRVQTFGAWWLKVVSSEVAPANREDVTRVKAAVVVKSPLPTIKGDQHLDTAQCAHSGWTDKVGIFTVHSLKLHAYFKGVLLWSGRLLLGNIKEENGLPLHSFNSIQFSLFTACSIRELLLNDCARQKKKSYSSLKAVNVKEYDII